MNIKHLAGDRSSFRGKIYSRGFTLVEVMIAMVMILLCIAAIAKAFNTGLFAGQDAERTGVAINIAQAEMEKIKNASFDDIIDKAATPDTEFPDFSTAVNASEGSNPKQVDVTVSWNTKGGSTSITLSTLIADLR